MEDLLERKPLSPPGAVAAASNGRTYVEAEWRNARSGANYAPLLAVRDMYDPDGLFFVHHGVGSKT
jgi:hypothetical protein